MRRPISKVLAVIVVAALASWAPLAMAGPTSARDRAADSQAGGDTAPGVGGAEPGGFTVLQEATSALTRLWDLVRAEFSGGFKGRKTKPDGVAGQDLKRSLRGLARNQLEGVAGQD